MPAFRQLLDAVSKAWREDGERVRDAAGQIAERLADAAAASLPAAAVDTASLDDAVQRAARGVRPRARWVRGAPKFPPSMVLEFLLRHHERTGSATALRMVTATAERMARGGMYDQLAGGFARYSVDAQWVVPHFEKMLYDNALLLRVYAHLHRVTGAPLALRVADETAAFLMRDLGTAQGGFASALDADTEGVEGKTYAWTPRPARRRARRRGRRLGGAAARGDRSGHVRARRLHAATAGGPRRPGALGTGAGRAARRARRPSQPARDDKVVTAWNGLAIVALAEGGAALDRPAWVDAAARAAELLAGPAHRRRAAAPLLARRRRRRGRGCARGLRRAGRRPARAAPGHRRRARWLAAATELLDVALAHFVDGTAASSTPPTTPRRCCTGPARSPTTRRRAVAPRWSLRSSARPS